MLIKIYPQNPNPKALAQVVDILENDGVIVYPTDTAYAFGCSLRSAKAIERIKAIRGKKETDMAIICSDLSHIADYARVDTPTFKLLKRNLPGVFTFILPASGKVPDKFLEKRKHIGIRIPDSPIALALVTLSEHPLVTASVKDDDMVEYTIDPELIDEKYGALVDAVIDGGYGEPGFSTVVDCTGEEPEIVREGLGELV